MTLFRPLPRSITRPASLVILLAWIVAMTVLVNRSYVQATSSNLATDLARYGAAAQWRGVYYRNEKIGFTVSQATLTDEGFELQEDGRLQMSLLGAQTAATIRTTVKVDRAFALRSFEFLLDPGTGGTTVRGELDGLRLHLSVSTASGTRREERLLTEPPVLAQNLARRLAGAGLKPGAEYRWSIFDPATLTNAPVTLNVGKREVVTANGTPVPAFRIEMDYSGLHTTSWISDTGEVLREQSPLGLETIRESAATARSMTVPFKVREDMLDSAAVVPVTRQRIDEPRDVRRLRLRLEGIDLSSFDLTGVGQTVNGDVIDIRDPRSLKPEASDPRALNFLQPEPFIESDAPEIRAEADAAVKGLTGARARAERLTRHVNAILDKKPTVSLPSAREVLRTRVGDCNEHTVLYVAMARSLGIPARIAVGLVSVRGAFYYHAWPEVYLDEGQGRGMWLPVDPTLNEFPADGTHLRLARGGLDRQAAILPLVGRLKITVLDLELAPNTIPIVVGRRPEDTRPLSISIPHRGGPGDCWSETPVSSGRR